MIPASLRLRKLCIKCLTYVEKTKSCTGRRGPSAGTPDILNKILDYLVFYHFRNIWDLCGGGSSLQEPPVLEKRREMYLTLYEEVAERTVRLCAQWQGVGFCHGVLNTDNMSLLGLTIDYGPYGWLDRCAGSIHMVRSRRKLLGSVLPGFCCVYHMHANRRLSHAMDVGVYVDTSLYRLALQV
jgi:hypothetical protein